MPRGLLGEVGVFLVRCVGTGPHPWTLSDHHLVFRTQDTYSSYNSDSSPRLLRLSFMTKVRLAYPLS